MRIRKFDTLNYVVETRASAQNKTWTNAAYSGSLSGLNTLIRRCVGDMAAKAAKIQAEKEYDEADFEEQINQLPPLVEKGKDDEEDI